MCGLAGMAAVDGRPLSPEFDSVLERMAHAVAHRGPDDTVIERDGSVGLAFTRLSLVDPAGGRQPLVSGDGSAVLIANGEVYNHIELRKTLPPDTRWRTRSDCEVLVHLYQHRGLDFLRDVRGMFALVLWDRLRNRLLLARDRFAIKPLYYARVADRVVFGSEIKALFADRDCPRRLDWTRALQDQALNAGTYLTEEPATQWFAGIEQVPPATIVELDLTTGRTRSHRYWSLDVAGPGDSAPEDAELVSRFGELLAESVSDCLMADVEVGLLLSGGVDSAAVAALAAPAGGLHTFTALTGSTTVNGDARFAQLVADELGVHHHQVLFEADRVPTGEEWKRLLWLLETPQCGPEQFYKFELHRFARAVRPELKAMLLGSAADEYAGGYSVRLAGQGGSWDDFLSAVRSLARQRDLHRRPALGPWWAEPDLPLLTGEVLRDTVDAEDVYASYLRWKLRDLQQYNCWHEDRTAAGNGTEARVPFLDHRLVELVAGIPPDRRRQLLWDKRILRDAVRDLLPPEVVERPKVPFFHGEGVWHTHRTFLRMLSQDGAELLDEALASDAARHFLHGDNMRRMLARLVADPAAGHVEVLLRLVNLGLLERMTAEPPAAPVTTEFAGLPAELRVHDWSAQREQIATSTIPGPRVGPEQVLRRADGVELVRASDDPATWYVAVDGSLQYVVDGEADGAWLRFLRSVDGQRSVHSVLASVGTDFDAVRELVEEAVECRVLALDSWDTP